jgi:hypothetical protein
VGPGKRRLPRRTGRSPEVRLTTSGQPIDDITKIEFLAKNVDVLNLSIEGIDKSSYEASRVGGSYERILWVLESFRNQIAVGAPIDLGVYTLVNLDRPLSQLETYIIKFYEHYKRYTPRIHFRAFGNQGSNSNMKLSQEVHGEVRCVCLSPFQFLQVRWNGQVSYCCAEVLREPEI